MQSAPLTQRQRETSPHGSFFISHGQLGGNLKGARAAQKRPELYIRVRISIAKPRCFEWQFPESRPGNRHHESWQQRMNVERKIQYSSKTDYCILALKLSNHGIAASGLGPRRTIKVVTVTTPAALPSVE